MKILFILLGLMQLFSQLCSQTLISSQSFENTADSWSYSVSPAPFTDPDAAWNILQTSQLPLSNMPGDGNAYWGVKDLYSTNGTSSWGEISFASVDLNLYEGVVLSFIYECVGFDSGDDLKYQLKINGYFQNEVLLIDGYNNLSIYDSVFISVPDTALSLEFTISVKQNGSSDYAGIDRIRLRGNVITPKPEPSEYAANLHQTAASPQTISIAWNEAEGIYLPDYWLLQLSENNNFTDPVDGVEFPVDADLSDGNLAIKLGSATLSYQFQGLNPSTGYALRLIPYSNSGSLTDYKFDESISIVQVNTFELNSIFFSEITDPQDNISARFIEFFNSSNYNLNLNQPAWYLCRQTNGGSWSCVALQGSIESMKTYTVANSTLEYLAVYGHTPNQSSSTVVSGNGNDVYALYYNGNQTNGILVDIYGVINEDGLGTAWDYTDKQALRKLTVTAASSTFNPSDWVIELSTAANCHPNFYGSIFTGAANQYWHQPENWKPGPPPVGANVWIRNSAQYDPVIQIPQSISSLRLDHLRNLKGHHLLSLSGEFIAACLIPSWTNELLGWKLFSAPGSGSAISNSDFTSDGYDFYWYDEQQHLWLNQKNSQNATLFETFTPGRSYLVAYDTTRIRLFKGNMIHEDIDIENLSNINHGWHLLGNPYPAPLVWNTENWNLNGISPYAYRLSASGNSYNLLFPGDTIQKFEGFWIKAGQSNAGLTIPLELNSIESEKESSRMDEKIGLSLHGQFGEVQTCWIVFDNESSPLYSFEEDALYMSPLKSSLLKFFIADPDSVRLSLSSMQYEKHKPIHLIIQGGLSEELLLSLQFQNNPSIYKPLVLRNRHTLASIWPDESGNFLIQTGTNANSLEFDLYFDYRQDENHLSTEVLAQIGKDTFKFSILPDEIPEKLQIYDLTGRLIAAAAWPAMPVLSFKERQFLIMVLNTNQSQYSRTILHHP